MTKNGIEYNLSLSDFNAVYYGLVFYFSSRSNMERFCETIDDAIEKRSKDFYDKYKMFVSNMQFLAILHYRFVERRGFYITDLEGEFYKCPQEMMVTGKINKKKLLEKPLYSETGEPEG